jgi:type I site-specific restriction endonuclease
MGLEVEILKMVGGGGGIVATIAVVILFLRQQEKMHQTLTQIAEKFTADVAQSQRAFQDQLGQLMGQQMTSQKLYQEQIKSLINDHISVTRETVGAVKGLDATVRGVDATVRSVETTVRELQNVVRQIVLDNQRRAIEVVAQESHPG